MAFDMNKIEEDAPSTIKEVGIHLAYMREDMIELKHLIQELPNGFATKEELLSVSNRVKTLEDDHGSFWVRFGIPIVSSICTAIILLLVLSFLNRLQ